MALPICALVITTSIDKWVDASLCEWSAYREKETTPDELVSTWDDSMRVFEITDIHTQTLQHRRNLVGLVYNYFLILSEVIVFCRGSSKDNACYILFSLLVVAS